MRINEDLKAKIDPTNKKKKTKLTTSSCNFWKYLMDRMGDDKLYSQLRNRNDISAFY